MRHSNGIAWDDFWSQRPAEDGATLWDVDRTQCVDQHMPWLQQLFTSDLPVADVGCGNGRQTEALADYFTPVYGFEVSSAALEVAQKLHPKDNILYRHLDLCDTQAVRDCHDELGDLHVYVRTVVHQMPIEWRQTATNSIATLLGKHGRGFLIEMGPTADEAFANWPRQEKNRSKLDDILEAGLVPARLEKGELEHLLDQASLEIIDTGEFFGDSAEHAPDGTVIQAPMQYFQVTSSR